MSLRIAVVGAGPAGFYTAGPLLDAGHAVDLYDRLPTPWGLVRAGVAPDHPNIKAVSRVFEKIAAKPGFRFFGNVDIGRDLGSDDLRRHYHAVVWTVGAQSDRQMGIPGEDLPGSLPATAFVGWYNGHPDFADLEVDLAVERVVVIGNGNVAIDCARMLALTHDELAATDTADPAIAAIAGSEVREIIVLGRRGPAQAAFTTPELLELGELAGADVIVDPRDLELDPASAAWLETEGSPIARRNVDVLRTYAARTPAGHPRRVVLRFLQSPIELVGDGRVEAIVIGRNRLEDDGAGGQRAVATGATETLPCGLVLRSVGYRGIAIDGVPFDERRCVIANVGGRVVDADGAVRTGEYCAGWIKRGPSGVIGTNKKDAAETVDLLLTDAADGVLPDPPEPPGAIDALIAARCRGPVAYAGWEAIDAAEKARAAGSDRPRVKLLSWDELLAAATIEP